MENIKDDSLIICPGCGLKLAKKSINPSKIYNASGECFELYGELYSYTLTEATYEFIHQHVVDAYAAQHSGGITKNIATIYALIGLCLMIDHGLTGKQVQKVHMRMPKRKWEKLDAPTDYKWMTIRDVLEAKNSSERRVLIRQWAISVWDSWGQYHDYIQNLADQYILLL
jgi:hypothetical protein